MIRWVVESSLKFRLLVLAVAAGAIAVGIVKLRELPVNVLPEFAPPTVEIQTEALGLSAPEVEQLITVPMEQDLLNGVAFLKDIRSESVPGLSRILLVFKSGTDPFVARQVVAERLTQAHALPNVSKPPRMLQPLSSENRVLMIGVSSKTVSRMQLSVLARWTIVPRLLGEAGVANVSIWGERDRQLQVRVDPERLRDRGVSLLQVIETTGNSLWVSPLTFLEASTPGTGGFIDTANQRLGIQHVSPITTASSLAKVSLEGAKDLRLGDVATVVEDHQPLIGDALTNDGPGLLLVVEKFPNASALDVTRRVESAIDEMRPGFSGVKLDTNVFRPANYIETSIDNLTTALIIGAALAVLLIGGLLYRWRTALIGVVAVPLSMIAAALVLYALGKTMNAIVFAGLAAALGIVVDDVVIGVENTLRRLRERPAERGSLAVLRDASLEMRRPTVYATLILALALVPVFFLERVSGAFFPDLAVPYLLAVAAALLVATTLTPVLCLFLFSKGSLERGASPIGRWLQGGYERALSLNLRRPQVAFVAAAAVVAAAVASLPFFDHSVLPTFKESQLLVRWDAPPGTSLPEMNRVTGLATRELRSIAGVSGVGAHAGRAVTADQVVGVNSGELWVSIDSSADYDATLASIEHVVDSYPGFSGGVETYSNERVREVLSGTKDDLVVRVYGEDLSTLDSTAERVRRVVSHVDGVSSARVERQSVEPTLRIEVNLAEARRHGIKPGDVRRAAATLVSGLVVGSLFEDQKVFDVVVWGTPQTRSSLTSVKQLLIDTPSGGHVRLGDVAAVGIGSNPTDIERENVSRRIDVSATLSGRDRESVAGDIQRRLQKMSFPLEYHAEVLGGEGQPQARLISLGVAAAIGILLLLQACFGSWRLAALAFATLPVAVAGGLLAALAGGGELTLGSYIGLFAVFGVSVRNVVLLVDRLRLAEQEEGKAAGAALVVRVAGDRFMPVVMTALATAMFMLPVVTRGTLPGYELVHALGIVVLGGLVTSSLLSLFVVPALYARFVLGRAAVPADEPSEELVPSEAAV